MFDLAHPLPSINTVFCRTRPRYLYQSEYHGHYHQQVHGSCQHLIIINFEGAMAGSKLLLATVNLCVQDKFYPATGYKQRA